MSTKSYTEETFYLHPIGIINRSDDEITLDIFEPYRPGLKDLGDFSHVVILWWVTQHDNQESRARLQVTPPYEEGRLTGVFACRAPLRPNPIAMTPCELLAVDEKEGIVRIKNIDAFDGTPIIDLKAYFPVSDRVKNASIPARLSDWSEWVPEEGLGLDRLGCGDRTE
jgi:tRNA-Thr(GGU) m(6)t(6)A37 methyltransferase TsaA